MKLHLILGQRKCSYPGQYAPEALDVADENTMSDNPEWFSERLAMHKKEPDFTSIGVLLINVPDSAIQAALDPKVPEVDAQVVES
jgi:hypothetical protein